MQQNENSNGFFPSIIKGTCVSVIVTLVSVLIFAFIIKLIMPTNGLIKTVNQFIKVLAVFLGCFICLRGSFGLIKGAFVGALASVIIYLIFSLMGGAVSFGVSFWIDIVFSSVIGALSGIVTVNTKKE